ncbi:DUF72 domain-containing protein [Planctomycetales bacterium 10988]|nr:DUF72 domain-containing protein [Planctomycetales bacterium 10988]
MIGNRFYLGCPIWACGDWQGSLFTKKAPRKDWLVQYSQVFNTVEGNSTFYGLPTEETVKRWIAETPPGFRFALKFPRAISHEGPLTHSAAETEAFLEILEWLRKGDRLGPSFLQLSPMYSWHEWTDLVRYLQQLPQDYPYAVEVRHRDYFTPERGELELETFLRERGIDRVFLDSRPLFSAPASTESERKTQQRKPRSPHRDTPTGKYPFLRLICRDTPEAAFPFMQEWAPKIAHWLQEGRVPFLYTHAPDDRYAPILGRFFYQELQKVIPDLEPMPPWLGEQEQHRQDQQQMLF